MKTQKLAAVAAAFIMILSLTAGCSWFGDQGEESSSQPESSFSEPESSIVESSEPESSEEEEPQSSQTGEVVDTITTDDENFNTLFAENAIDQAYRDGQDEAYSTTDMLNLATEFTNIWKNEVDSAYKRLLDAAGEAEKEEFRAEQEQWVAETPDALQKIAEEAEAAGGSMAQVTGAGATMEYYRARAAQLYRELYDYTGTLELDF